MIRLRIALGVASSLVAVAALSIVLAGSGEAQGNGPNVTVVNTPLPVTGDITATVAGNVSATIINPSSSPVFIRDVDTQELWQENKLATIDPSFPSVTIDFASAPAGKALVIEHINIRVTDLSSNEAPELSVLYLVNSLSFGLSSFPDARFLVTRAQGASSIADESGKFYVAPGDRARLFVQRKDLSASASVIALLTGHLVNYP